MHKRSVLALIVAASLGVLPSRPATAASACVNNLAQLALVLAAAQDNGEDDVIFVEVGTYTLGAELDYFAPPSEEHDLAIYGGMAPGCTGLATSGSTILDGGSAARILYIIGRGSVTVSGFVFAHGNAGAGSGGGLVISGGANVVATVARNFFLANEAPGNDGGSAAEIGAEIIILVDNVFLANSGGSTIHLIADSYADVNNNTVVDNVLANHVGRGALEATGTGQYSLANNILWNNEGSDVYDESGAVWYYNNDVGVRAGDPPQFETDGLSVDPEFEDIGLRLSPTSPLVNVGYDTPYGGIGDVDLSGNARLTGKHVDLGAYETDVLLRDGFGG
jgi:hypothetical protein